MSVPETERLTLRPMTLDDVDGLLEIFADPETMWAYPSTKDRAETEAWIRWAMASYAVNGWGLWAVIRRDDGRFLGDCGPMLQPVEGEQVPELGYHIVRAEWGRGYATEAAIACRDWFFANTEHDRLVSIVWPPNTASRRVAERVHARMRLFVWERSGTEECLYETRRSDLALGQKPGGTSVKFTNSLIIRRQPAEVFGYLSDPANIPKWNYAIASTRQITPGGIRAGSRFRQTRTLPRPAEEELEVTEIEPNRRLVLRGDLGPLHGSLAYELEEVPDGTRVTNVADLKAGGPVGFVAELAGGRVRAAVADNLGVLKRILEEEASPR